jgi:hypothetical protein
MRLPLLLAFPLFLAVPLHAQRAAAPPFDVGGRVLDGATGEPIAEAVVRLTDTGVVAVSDSAGRFVLRHVPPGTHPWEIGRIGYAKWKEDVEATEEDEFTVRLLPQPEVLEGLVAIGDRFRDRRMASGMSSRVFEHGEVARAAGGDLHGFLQVRLGVPLVTCNNRELEKNCAWLRGERVEILVFVDEQRATGGLSELYGLPPYDVHSIELFSGGTMIRVYTEQFIRRAAREGVTLLPLPFAPGVPVIGALDRKDSREH